MPEQIQDAPVSQIIHDESQPRKTFDEEGIVGGAQTVAEIGILQPLRVRRDGQRFVPIDGERRFRMAVKAGLATVPVIVEEKELSDADVLYRQLVANCHEDLPVMEKARACSALMKMTGWSATQAKVKLGFSSAQMSKLGALLELPAHIQQQIENGSIPASAAYELAHIEDPQKQSEMAALIAGGKMTRDEVSAAVKKSKKPGKSSGKSARLVLNLGQGRSMTIAGPALTSVDTLISWLEELLTSCRKANKSGFAVNTLQKMLKDQAKS